MITPLRDYVVLKEIRENKTKSGIHFADDANLDLPNIAELISIGPDCKSIWTMGGKFIIQRHLFTEINSTDGKVLLGKEEGIIAIA